jgi:hypothetical protein
MRINILISTILAALIMVSCQNQSQNQTDTNVKKEKTAFQTSGQWKPVTDVRADVAIVYGAGDRPARDDRPAMTFEERVQTWRDRGYTTHFMTGIAWGNYQDYFTGEWDGKYLFHHNLLSYLIQNRGIFLKVKSKDGQISQ